MNPTSGLEESFMGSVTVGERGQVVIPAAARERCGIEPGDKLLSFVHTSGGGVMLIKVDALSQMADELRRLELAAAAGTGNGAATDASPGREGAR
jgi:AbrB family looped-hinge helix DNA binding protein